MEEESLRGEGEGEGETVGEGEGEGETFKALTTRDRKLFRLVFRTIRVYSRSEEHSDSSS